MFELRPISVSHLVAGVNVNIHSEKECEHHWLYVVIGAVVNVDAVTEKERVPSSLAE